ncbi:unnamed protein product [Ixodes hexagonus]
MSIADIRQQLGEQLKCLDVRLETQVALVGEMQDYFRRRAEVELEYSRALDKMARTLMLRHKAEKPRREQWHLFSSYGCWQQLVASTRRQSRDHAALGEIYTTTLVAQLAHLLEDVQRIYRKCRGIGAQQHEELLKVLHELHTVIVSFYGAYPASSADRAGGKHMRTCLGTSPRPFHADPSYTAPRHSDAQANKLHKLQKRHSICTALLSFCPHPQTGSCRKCARSTTTAATHDLEATTSDKHDKAAFTGRKWCLSVYSLALRRHCFLKSAPSRSRCKLCIDDRRTLIVFLHYAEKVLHFPVLFFSPTQPQRVSVEHPIEEELDQRLRQLNKRLTSLCTENDEIWKTLETAERSLLDMIAAKECDCSALFEDRNGVKQPETLALKLRADKQETEDFYLEKFRDYTLGCNVVARLQAKAELMRTALGKDCEASCGATPSPAHTPQAPGRPPPPRKKRIGRQATRGQPKLFEGSLEEYLEATDQEVPLVIRSCVRVINLYGLHHQGVFRVSGSQVEINHFRDCFERGEDPLSEVSDASDINSVAGVLKLYLRELREPLFPIFYFEQLMEISPLNSFSHSFRHICASLSSYIIVPVLFFSFSNFIFLLSFLSEFSDENMMDPYNLAICFGPTLVPIPEDKDQVQYQNLVNELVKGIIVYQEEIFPDDGGLVYEKYISAEAPDDIDVGESPPEQIVEQAGTVEVDAAPAEEGSEVLEATAQYDFAARSERELSFKRGDRLTLYTQVSPDWWRGHFAGKDGLVPDKYILLRIRDEDRTSSEGSDRRRSSDSLPGGSPPLALRGGAGRTPNSRRRSLSPCFPGGPPPDPRKLRPSTSMGDAPALELSAYDISVETSNQELARDLDHALARVHTSIDSIERSHKVDAPDLVLDLPVSPNSPEAADMTAAERFALSNQCTLKKGATRGGAAAVEGPPTSPAPERGPKPPVKAKPVMQSQTLERNVQSAAERAPPPEKGYKQTSF